MLKGYRWFIGAFVLIALVLPPSTARAQPPDPVAEATALLARLPWPLVSVQMEDETLSVCLRVSRDTLALRNGSGVETVEDAVAHALTPLDWRTLHVLAPDADGVCRPLSDVAGGGASPEPLTFSAANAKIRPAWPETPFPRSLAGKVIFVSAGHGWEWNGYAWRTQRPPYQQIVEDHNNAEAVDQYLIPYLERAGAIVIPVRERDWNGSRVIVDDTDGGFSAPGWVESASEGYGTHYRFAPVSTDGGTMTANWTLTVPADGRYALYAWIPAAANRAPDARYTVRHAGGTSEVRLDQRLQPSTWRYLGTFPFRAGTATVTLSNLSGTAGAYVVADALRLGGGLFDDLRGIETTASQPPNRPWWESCTFYYSQWMGLDPDDWASQNWNDFNDVVARPMYARWRYSGLAADAIYISWHTNGWNGTVRGTESYIHDGSTYPVTPGSADLQRAVHTELIHDIRAGWDAGWVDRGRRSRNLGELRLLWDGNPANRLPGVLVEIAYHDNPEDAAALKEPRFNQLAARAIYQGIVHYFEGKDGVDLVELPEPPTHLYAQNLGGGAVRIAWQPSPTDGVGLVGDPATAYRLYLSEDGFGWGEPIAVQGTSITLSDLPQGAVRYFYVTAINDGGESFPTEVLGFRVGDPSLLIVNGFDRVSRTNLVPDDDPVEGFNLRMWLDRINRGDYVVTHGEAVPWRYAWDAASNEAVCDRQLDLGRYAVVDWLLGEEAAQVDGVFDAQERAVLADYLDNGGNLLLSGSEWAWWLDGAAPAFLGGTLHARYIADDAGTYRVVAADDGVLRDVGEFTFDAAGEYDADRPDVIAPADGEGRTALTYVGGSGGTAALHTDDGRHCLMLFGFPLETVPPAQLAPLMERTLDALHACAVGAEAAIAVPGDGRAYRAAPTAVGTASANSVRVEVQLRRESDGLFWDGSAWQDEARWLVAEGTTNWRYSLPPLEDGGYSLSARATNDAGRMGEVQTASFQIDSVVPAQPLLLVPEDGLMLVAVAPVLRWSSVADGGSAIHYRVRIDGVDYEAGQTTLAVPLREGGHRWQVQAVDAAGNEGAWSAARTFALSQFHAYLPVTLRRYAPAAGTPPPSPTPTPLPSPTPTPTPTPPACTVVLQSDFEAGDDGWTFGNAVERSTAQAHGGTYAVQMGLLPGEAGGTLLYSSVYRTVALPAGGTLRLSLWLYPLAEEAEDDLQYVIVRDADGASHTLYSALEDTRNWTAHTFDLGAYAGQTVTLYVGVKNDGDAETAALYADEITITQCP